MAEKLGENLNTTVVVDNRPGAGGNIGSNVVAKADPDGYTLVLGTLGTHSINDSVYKEMPYDAVKDFAPISLIAAVPNILVANPSVKANSVQELIALAKSNPGAITFASSGNGSSIHLSGEMFKSLAGVEGYSAAAWFGLLAPASAETQTLSELEKAWSLNIRCAMQCMQALLPGMKEARFGRIVNMSSRASLGKELRTAYAASKAGLIGMTRVWALELGQYGITSNAIGPGPIRTELFDKANPPGHEQTQKIIDAVPVKRVGTPQDIAQAASYLLDERSGFTTGQILYVCGGMTVGVASV